MHTSISKDCLRRDGRTEVHSIVPVMFLEDAPNGATCIPCVDLSCRIVVFHTQNVMLTHEGDSSGASQFPDSLCERGGKQ